MFLINKLLGLFLKSSEDLAIFKRMAGENFSLYKRDYAIAIVCLLITAGITAYSAWLMGPIVKDVFYGNNFSQALNLSLTVVVIFLVKGYVTYKQTTILQRIGNNIVARYQRRLFDHMLKLDVGFFTSTHSVTLISRLNQNIGGVRNLLNTVILGYVRDMVTLIGLIAVMIFRDPLMSAVIFIVGPIALIIVAGYARRVRKIARQEIQISAQVATSMQEAAHGITVVKAFTLEDQLNSKLGGLTEEAERRANKIARITARTSPLMETLAGFAIAAVIAYGGWRVIHHGYEPSDLTSFMTALLLAYEPAKKLARMRVALERSLVNARMIYELVDAPISHGVDNAGAKFVPAGGEIVFDDVTFSYSTQSLPDVEGNDVPIATSPPVIHNMSFTAKRGQTTALVGPSGGGKSTIVSLIQRFYTADSGTVKIDGQDIAELNVRSLRDHIGYVSQSPILFQGTIRENLRYARPDATDEEIIEAARNAQAHDFIMELPHGYESHLGENATNLSGGQRQRISIARAILRNAPILLLDEATSALDNKSEASVQKALDTLMVNRTTIVIAHRLSTISNANKIIVVDNGRVVDQGSHKQLMKRSKSVYADLQKLTEN